MDAKLTLAYILLCPLVARRRDRRQWHRRQRSSYPSFCGPPHAKPLSSFRPDADASECLRMRIHAWVTPEDHRRTYVQVSVRALYCEWRKWKMEEDKRSSRTRILGIGIVYRDNLKALGMVRGTQDRHSPCEAMDSVFQHTITRYTIGLTEFLCNRMYCVRPFDPSTFDSELKSIFFSLSPFFFRVSVSLSDTVLSRAGVRHGQRPSIICRSWLKLKKKERETPVSSRLGSECGVPGNVRSSH